MTKPHHQIYLLLPLIFITWWSMTFGFKTKTHNTTQTLTVKHLTNKEYVTDNSFNVSTSGSIGDNQDPTQKTKLDKTSVTVNPEFKSEVEVKIKPVYEGSSKRPSEYKVKYTVDGEDSYENFPNGAN